MICNNCHEDFKRYVTMTHEIKTWFSSKKYEVQLCHYCAKEIFKHG